VFAESDSQRARTLEADALEQLGYQSESAVWRNIYLVGAKELREGPPAARPARVASADVARAVSIEQLWDALGTRLDGPRAWASEIVIAWRFSDVEEQWTVSVCNGALNAFAGATSETPHATVTLTRAAFDAILLKEGEPAELFASGQITVEGQAEKLGELLGLLDEGDSAFAIVTP